MPSNKAIVACFGVLTASGIEAPPDLDATLAAWTLVLEGMPDDTLTNATAAWLRSPESRFGKWPTPGALLHVVTVDDADEAWGLALRHLQRRNSVMGCPPLCEDPGLAAMIDAAVQGCGGWTALGLTHDKQMMAQRASFRAAYRGLAQRRRSGAPELEGPRLRLLGVDDD